MVCVARNMQRILVLVAPAKWLKELEKPMKRMVFGNCG
jgi:hypothetical protein